MKIAFEERFKLSLSTTHPVMLWLVEHATSKINRFTIGSGGLAPTNDSTESPIRGMASNSARSCSSVC